MHSYFSIEWTKSTEILQILASVVNIRAFCSLYGLCAINASNFFSLAHNLGCIYYGNSPFKIVAAEKHVLWFILCTAKAELPNRVTTPYTNKNYVISFFEHLLTTAHYKKSTTVANISVPHNLLYFSLTFRGKKWTKVKQWQKKSVSTEAHLFRNWIISFIIWSSRKYTGFS